MTKQTPTFTAFSGTRLLQTGPVETVLKKVKEDFDQRNNAPILVFEDATGKQTDFDLEGTPEEVIAHLAGHPLLVRRNFDNPDVAAPATKRPGPGRPRLGVVSREISLFPRHWKWLEGQPQGASAAIRKLIEAASAREPEKDRARRAREAAGNFMWAMAGNLPNFEEASRALYAGDTEKLNAQIAEWPKDVREYLSRLLKAA